MPSAGPNIPVAPTPNVEQPAGQLVCRMKTPARTYEFFLQWNDGKAHGTLRSMSADGVLVDEAIKAERYQGMLVVDHPDPIDLTDHVALIREGARSVQMGPGGGPWANCE